MATRITPARRAPEASKRKPRQRAAAPVATSLDLQAAVRAAVREVLVPEAQMKPAAEIGYAAAIQGGPAPSPETTLETAISQTSLAIDELTMTVQLLTERLERTVLAPGINNASDGKAEAFPAMGASPVLHQITALHASIRCVNERLHDIGNRLEA